MQLIQYLWACYRAYRLKSEVTYFALSSHGVPQLLVIIGRDRKAWRVSQLAASFKSPLDFNL